MRSSVFGYWPALAPPAGAFSDGASQLVTGGDAPVPDPGGGNYQISIGPGVTIYVSVHISTPISGVSGPEVSWPTATAIV